MRREKDAMLSRLASLKAKQIEKVPIHAYLMLEDYQPLSKR